MHQEITHLHEKLYQAIEQRGITISEDIYDNLKLIVDEKSPFVAISYPEHSLARMF